MMPGLAGNQLGGAGKAGPAVAPAVDLCM